MLDTASHAAEGPDPVNLRTAALSLLRHCRERDWSGYDPYDGLNSRLFNATPLAESRFARLAITQFLKRLPVNIRRLLLISPTTNPKALALFLASVLKFEDLGMIEPGGDAERMAIKLAALSSPEFPYWRWGYSFPWQTRTDLLPRYAPNLVCTVFVADALLDAFERRRWKHCAAMAERAAVTVQRELFWKRACGAAGFAYPTAESRAAIYNANFLGAALLCRVAEMNGERRLREVALEVTRWSVNRQENDGSWKYGEGAYQGWVDNFHTGYNLCALRAVGTHAGTDEFEPALRRGFAYYRERFFRSDGAPKYYHDRTYPIDVHAAAQSIITLTVLADLDESAPALAEQVLAWTMGHLRDRDGHFYYQAYPVGRNKISYMRWSQAWMLRAMATLLEYRASLREKPDQTAAAVAEGR